MMAKLVGRSCASMHVDVAQAEMEAANKALEERAETLV